MRFVNEAAEGAAEGAASGARSAASQADGILPPDWGGVTWALRRELR